MDTRSLTCPNCGGHIEVTQDLMRYFCPYCGASVAADDGINRILIRDEAKLKALELQKAELLRKEQEEKQQAELLAKAKKRWRIAFVSYWVAWILYTLILIAIPEVPDLFPNMHTVILLVWLFLGPLFIQFVYPFINSEGHYVKWGKNEDISRKRVFIIAVAFFFGQIAVILIWTTVFSKA